jgi:hypothetical protein
VMTPGSASTIRIRVTPTRTSFDSAISFGCAELPEDASCAFSQVEALPGGAPAEVTLTIRTGGNEIHRSSTPPGQYRFHVIGTAGGLVRYSSVSLTVR